MMEQSENNHRTSRPVLITGLGPVCGLGLGIEEVWSGIVEGRSAVRRIEAFDPAGFDCRIAAEAPHFKVQQFVPKTYRKAAKVMARDIQLAVAAADLAARDAGLRTRGTAPDTQPSYNPSRMGAHIGAGLIAAELDELTSALVEARAQDGSFDMHKWGAEGINHLTPLWLLKYLPNMLACHVTIIHDTQGPSNTITCQEASCGLSIGESLRVIQRGAADLCFSGGADSKLNPMAYLRQEMGGRLNTSDNDRPGQAVRPFCETAAGTVLGEGGGIVILEAEQTFRSRSEKDDDARAYARVEGFGASQSVHRESRNFQPQPDGRAIAVAIEAAMGEAGVDADEVDLIVPFGLGVAGCDRAEAAALKHVLGKRLAEVPVASLKPLVGYCSAGAGALDVIVAARALAEQRLPAVINCDQPVDGLCARSAVSHVAEIRHVLVYSCGMGGQNAALVLGRV